MNSPCNDVTSVIPSLLAPLAETQAWSATILTNTSLLPVAIEIHSEISSASFSWSCKRFAHISTIRGILLNPITLYFLFLVFAETWMCREAQKICCCSTGRSQTAPGGLSWKGTSSRPTPKVLLTLPPGACVCGSFSKEFRPPHFRWCCEELCRILPPRGPGDVSHSVCPVLKAWGNQRLGFLANSFLQQIFIGFLLCPHHSSPSCQGRQACG